MIFKIINIEYEYYLIGNHRPEIGNFVIEWQNPYYPDVQKITSEYELAPDIQAPIIATTKTSVKFPLMEELPCIKSSQLMDLWIQNETIEDVAKEHMQPHETMSMEQVMEFDLRPFNIPKRKIK